MTEAGNETLFTSQATVAGAIEQLLLEAQSSVDAAMYRITHPRLALALGKARNRGLSIRLLVDRNKYNQTEAARDLMAQNSLPVHTLYGRKGKGSKLHHKFVVLDRHVVLAGSYNWTVESEERNFDHLLILRDPALVSAYQQEFERLWSLETASQSH